MAVPRNDAPTYVLERVYQRQVDQNIWSPCIRVDPVFLCLTLPLLCMPAVQFFPVPVWVVHLPERCASVVHLAHRYCFLIRGVGKYFTYLCAEGAASSCLLPWGVILSPHGQPNRRSGATPWSRATSSTVRRTRLPARWANTLAPRLPTASMTGPLSRDVDGTPSFRSRHPPVSVIRCVRAYSSVAAIDNLAKPRSALNKMGGLVLALVLAQVSSSGVEHHDICPRNYLVTDPVSILGDLYAQTGLYDLWNQPRGRPVLGC